MKINLIIRDQNNFVKSVESIDFNKDEFNDCDSFYQYFNSYYKPEIHKVNEYKLEYSVDFEIESKIEYFSCLAKKKKNWIYL